MGLIVPGYTLVTVPLMVVGSGPFTAHVPAPSGYSVVSAGWDTTGGQDGATLSGMITTAPTSDLSAWNFTWTTEAGNGPFGPQQSGTAYLLCVKNQLL